MKLQISNLGSIKECDLEVGDFTILVGGNNTGKTYLTYTLYGVLKYWTDFIDKPIIEELASKLLDAKVQVLSGEDITQLLSESLKIESDIFNNRISRIFNDREETFASSKVKLDLSYNVQNHVSNLTKLNGDISDFYPYGRVFCQSDGNNLIYRIIEDADTDLDAELFTSEKVAVHFKSVRVHFIVNFFIETIFKPLFFSSFLITAERLGISLFYKEIDGYRSNIVDDLQRQLKEGKMKKRDWSELVIKRTSFYVEPVSDHISFVRNLNMETSLPKSSLAEENSEVVDNCQQIIKEMLGVDFVRGPLENEIRIRGQARKNKSKRYEIPLHLSSSSVRCLVDIYYFLSTQASRGDILIIDEPESHLTILNQRRMAKLLVAIVNAGVKVFITTHSDLMLKEVNNLILLSSEFAYKSDWLEENKDSYSPSDLLDSDKLRVYHAVDGTLARMEVTDKGMDVPFLDKEIQRLFEASATLDYYINSGQ